MGSVPLSPLFRPQVRMVVEEDPADCVGGVDQHAVNRGSFKPQAPSIKHGLERRSLADCRRFDAHQTAERGCDAAKVHGRILTR